MRIELLDPRWKHQKVMAEEKTRESSLADNVNVTANLARLASKRTDVFEPNYDESAYNHSFRAIQFVAHLVSSCIAFDAIRTGQARDTTRAHQSAHVGRSFGKRVNSACASGSTRCSTSVKAACQSTSSTRGAFAGHWSQTCFAAWSNSAVAANGYVGLWVIRALCSMRLRCRYPFLICSLCTVPPVRPPPPGANAPMVVPVPAPLRTCGLSAAQC